MGLLSYGGFCLVLAVGLLLACALGTYLPLLSGSTPWPVCRVPFELFLSVLNVDTPKFDDGDSRSLPVYIDVIGKAYTWIIVVFTVVLTFVAMLDKVRYRGILRKEAEKHKRELAERQVVEVRPIVERGKDDVATLAELLANCEKAVMFAGSFDWLLRTKNGITTEETKRLTARVNDLIADKKITFVSHCTGRADVEARLSKIDASFAATFSSRFVDKSKRGIKVLFTFVWYDGHRSACCTRVGRISELSDAEENNILVGYNGPESWVLLHLVDQLTDEPSLRAELARQLKKRN